jgi:hypothetical protein
MMFLIKDIHGRGNLFGNLKVVCGSDDRLPNLALFENKIHQPRLTARVESSDWFIE